MSTNRNMKLEDMFDMVTWSPYEEKFYVDILIDYSNNGKLFSKGNQSAVLKEIASKLSECFGKPFSYMKVLKKFDSLKKRYNVWEAVTFWHGVRFDISTNRCEASNATWEAILKEHPYAKKYKNEGEKLWVELSLIFGGQSPRNTYKIQLFDNQQKSEKTIVISDSEDDDLGDGICDKESMVGNEPSKGVNINLPVLNDGKSKVGYDKLLGKLKVGRFEDLDSVAQSGASSTASSYWP